MIVATDIERPAAIQMDRLEGWAMLCQRVRTRGMARGIHGVCGTPLAAALSGLAHDADVPMAVILPTTEECSRMADDMAFFHRMNGQSVRLAEYPAPHALNHVGHLPSSDLASRQAAVLGSVAGSIVERVPMQIVSSASSLLAHLPDPSRFRQAVITITNGQAISRERVCEGLESGGYHRVSLVEGPGDWVTRGGIIDIYPFGDGWPVRVEWDDDRVHSMRRFDPATQASVEQIHYVTIPPLWVHEGGTRTRREWGGRHASLLDYLAAGTVVVAHERSAWDPEPAGAFVRAPFPLVSTSLLSHGSEDVCWEVHSIDHMKGRLEEFGQMVDQWRRDQWTVWLTSENDAERQHLVGLLNDRGWLDGYPWQSMVGHCSTGFLWPALRWAVIPNHELFARYRTRPGARGRVSKGKRLSLTDLMELKIGDAVVHTEHGIGRYLGVSRLRIEDVLRDFLSLEYADDNKLHVPLERCAVVQRYLGGGESPRLSQLGTAAWERMKARVKIKARLMAEQLLKLYADRAVRTGHVFSPDSTSQAEFEGAFVYPETADQRLATDAIKREMEQSEPMDHLVCGDVGYGKTEVAMRAAFKAVKDPSRRQVAVLVPTTILADQHERTFRERMADHDIRIAKLSRFVPAAKRRAVLDGLRAGTIDIVIGTHQLLQKTIAFHRLGLVIVDEEQRFGVGHKERLKEWCRGVDVLTLTATPIPRTLHFALSGLRSLSTIQIPPEGRVPVLTFVHHHQEAVIRAAIERELSRGGQVFYVVNRIDRLSGTAQHLAGLLPKARIGIAHGQLRPVSALEATMEKFFTGALDVLVATSIVELGLDLPNVNTLIVEDADRFGLSELYQLRGRIGRSTQQAYAYLTHRPERPLSMVARERLSAIAQAREWGAGFRIAMKDMELRGAGNLLGAEQHGFVASVGFELYVQLLAEAVADLKGAPSHPDPDPVVSVHVDAYIPTEYVTDETNKLLVYRELSHVESVEALEQFKAHVEDRYGALPEPVRALCHVVDLKIRSRSAGIIRLEEIGEGRCRFSMASGEDVTIATGHASWPERYEIMLGWLKARTCS